MQASSGDLSQVIQLLVSGLSGERAKEYMEIIQRGAVDPGFNECLATVFHLADPSSIASFPVAIPPTLGWNHLREIAGLTLKNNILRHAATLGPSTVLHIGCQAFDVLTCGETRLIRTAGQILAMITKVFGLELWRRADGGSGEGHDLMQKLSGLVHHGNPSAFIALRYLFEDAHGALGAYTQDILFMVCHRTMGSVEAIECLVAAYEVGAEMIWPTDPCCYTDFQRGLWNASEAAARALTTILSHDVPVVIRQGILRLMRCMLAYRDAFLLPPEIANAWVQYILHLFTDSLYFSDCCSFLTDLCQVANDVEDLSDLQQDIFLVHITPQHIAQIVPLLLTRMAYSDEEAMDILEHDSIRVRDLHVKPRGSHRGRASSVDPMAGGGGSGGAGEDEEEDGAATMRSAATNCLQGFSLIQPSAVWFELRSVLQRRMEDADWKMRESSLMALGAITHGCFRLLRKDFASITTLMFERATNDAHVLVRCTACWLIANSCSLLLTAEAHDKVQQGFQVVLQCSLQDSKRLQWASISSLQRMTVELMRYGKVHLDRVAPQIAQALPKLATQCQTNNLMLLLDLFDGLMRAYPSLPYDALLQVLFSRLEEARKSLDTPESVVVREMLYIFTPIAHLLQSGLTVPGEAIEQLANMSLRCIQYFVESAATVDTDYYVYSVHLLSVLIHIAPEKYSGEGSVMIHVHILNAALVLEVHEVVVAALLYLEKLVQLYGGVSILRNGTEPHSSPSASPVRPPVAPPAGFLAEFEQNIYPRLSALLRRQAEQSVECDAVWTIGQCMVQLQHALHPSWQQQHTIPFMVDLLRKVQEHVRSTTRRLAVVSADGKDLTEGLSRILALVCERVDLLSENDALATTVQTFLTLVRYGNQEILERVLGGTCPSLLQGAEGTLAHKEEALALCFVMISVQRLPNDEYKGSATIGLVRLLSCLFPVMIRSYVESVDSAVYNMTRHFLLCAQSFHDTVPHPHQDVCKCVGQYLQTSFLPNTNNTILSSILHHILESIPPMAQKIQRQYLSSCG